MGFARKAYDKAKARKKASRSKGKPVKPVRVEFDPNADRRDVRLVLKDYRDAA